MKAYQLFLASLFIVLSLTSQANNNSSNNVIRADDCPKEILTHSYGIDTEPTLYYWNWIQSQTPQEQEKIYRACKLKADEVHDHHEEHIPSLELILRQYERLGIDRWFHHQ